MAPGVCCINHGEMAPLVLCVYVFNGIQWYSTVFNGIQWMQSVQMCTFLYITLRRMLYLPLTIAKQFLFQLTKVVLMSINKQIPNNISKQCHVYNMK